jgi:hypothetical protein
MPFIFLKLSTAVKVLSKCEERTFLPVAISDEWGTGCGCYGEW